MNEHLYIVQTEDIVEAINVMITRKKNPKINKQAIFTCIHVQCRDLLIVTTHNSLNNIYINS